MNTARSKKVNRLKVKLILAAALLAACILALVGVQTPAGAAFPGKNSKITFVRGTDNESEDREIFVMEPVDSNGDGDCDNQTRLTNNTSVDSLPAFSSDGEDRVHQPPRRKR